MDPRTPSLLPRKRAVSKLLISPPVPGSLREYETFQADPSSPAKFPIRDMASRMSTRLLDPFNDQALQQKKAVKREAQLQAEAIHEKLRRVGHEIPKFEFLELIGKGAYGRVFKCRDQVNNRVVALKVIDVDNTDYKVNWRAKDDTIESTVHEIKVLKQLTDSKAKNVNIFYDAFQVHSQLWIVSDYCPGGSVHTLMRATDNKVPEKYILVIARELAAGLKAIHDAGIIHRDVKSANVMIHEKGSLQVIDFGVAGILQSRSEKRSTIIGTPHWMPPELHKTAPLGGLQYGTEVDVWAFGCTLIECATGLPPNTRTEPGRRLGGILGRAPPRLNDEKFSPGLRELIAFVLEPKAIERPSMTDVLTQPYLVNTDEKFPTDSLADLVKTYYQWEFSGGKRQSLFYQGGALAAEHPGTIQDGEEWNFSTTAGFAQQVHSEVLEPDFETVTVKETDTPNSSQQDSVFSPQAPSDLTIRASTDTFTSYLPRPSFAPAPQLSSTSDQFRSTFESSTSSNQPESTFESSSASTRPLSSFDSSLYVPDDFERYFSSETVTAARTFDMDESYANLPNEGEIGSGDLSALSLEHGKTALRLDEHVKRGEKALGGLFDREKEPYKYTGKHDFEDDLTESKFTSGFSRAGSDLPLRSASNESEVHHEVEYGDRSGAPYEVPRIDLSTANTSIRARRANEKGINEPIRASNDKAAMLGWKFPDHNVSDADAPATMTGPKRATMDWKFPSMDPSHTPAPVRPSLKHSTTAPVGAVMQSAFPANPHQSLAVLDLDALYDSDAFSPAPTATAASTSQPSSRAAPLSRRSGLPYDPNETFADAPTSPEEEFDDEPRSSKAAVRPPVSPAWPSSPEDTPETRPRPLSKRAAKRAAAAAHNAAAKAASVAAAASSSSVAGPSSSAVLAGPSSSAGRAFLASASTGSRGAPSVFDNIMPPSAEAMAPGASPEVIEVELRRLLTQFRDGLGELGRAFAERDAEGDYDLSSSEEDGVEGPGEMEGENGM